MSTTPSTSSFDYFLDEEHEALRSTVEDFAHRVVAPRAAAIDEAGEFPYDLVSGMAAMGLFGLPFPESYGGMGGDYFALCLAIEELARVDSSVAITLEAAVSLGAMPVFRFGTEEQRATWLPQLTSGSALAAFGLTEPDGGTDAGATRTRAVLTDGTWRIDGTKAFITNAGTDITSLVTVTAVTGEVEADADGRAGGRGGSSPRKEISSFLVPVPRAGLTVAKPYSKVGWHASDTREISLAGVEVPAENLLGERGRGFANFLSILDEGRIAIAALAVGLAQGCVDESIAYATSRRAFGSAIGSFQAIQFKISDMAVRAHTARLAYHDAARRMLVGKPFKKQAAMAKLYASEIAVTNAREATQIHGGYGFMNEAAVARFWRDSKILEIGEGTSEVQRMLIARELGLPGA